MEQKTYYLYIPIKMKELLKEYTTQFTKQTNRSVILTAAKYKNYASGLKNSQGANIAEKTELLGFVLTADSVDISEDILELVEKNEGKVFDNANDYLNFIETL